MDLGLQLLRTAQVGPVLGQEGPGTDKRGPRPLQCEIKRDHLPACSNKSNSTSLFDPVLDKSWVLDFNYYLSCFSPQKADRTVLFVLWMPACVPLKGMNGPFGNVLNNCVNQLPFKMICSQQTLSVYLPFFFSFSPSAVLPRDCSQFLRLNSEINPAEPQPAPRTQRSSAALRWLQSRGSPAWGNLPAQPKSPTSHSNWTGTFRNPVYNQELWQLPIFPEHCIKC